MYVIKFRTLPQTKKNIDVLELRDRWVKKIKKFGNIVKLNKSKKKKL